jgi:hypothetical protein
MGGRLRIKQLSRCHFAVELENDLAGNFSNKKGRIPWIRAQITADKSITK